MEVSDKKLGTGWRLDYRQKAEARVKQDLLFIQSFPHSMHFSCGPVCARHVTRPEGWGKVIRQAGSLNSGTPPTHTPSSRRGHMTGKEIHP